MEDKNNLTRKVNVIMEKVKVNINGREYNLKVDVEPKRIINIAKSLEAQIKETSRALINRSEQEVLTLIALNILDESEKQILQKEKEISELNNDLQIAREQAIINEQKSNAAFKENLYSAESEMEQLANVKDEENELLRQKLIDYEKDFERFVSEREDEILALKETFNSGISEMNHIAMIKDSENAKLRNTLNSYESSFDLYVKLKEEEIIKLKEEAEVLNAEIDDLRQRLAAISDDGQLTIC